MSPAELVIPPPTPKLLDYPVAVAIAAAVVATALLLIISGRFDHTRGTFTISLLIVLAFVATDVFVLLFTVPSDPETSNVIGGLTAAMGAVVAYWLGRKEPPKDG